LIDKRKRKVQLKAQEDLERWNRTNDIFHFTWRNVACTRRGSHVEAKYFKRSDFRRSIYHHSIVVTDSNKRLKIYQYFIVITSKDKTIHTAGSSDVKGQ